MAKRAIVEDIPEIAEAPAAVVPEPPAPSFVAAPAAVPEPVAVADTVLCRDCKHWRRPWPAANMGECGVSRKYFANPHMTTDLSSCSQAER